MWAIEILYLVEARSEQQSSEERIDPNDVFELAVDSDLPTRVVEVCQYQQTGRGAAGFNRDTFALVGPNLRAIRRSGVRRRSLLRCSEPRRIDPVQVFLDDDLLTRCEPGRQQSFARALRVGLDDLLVDDVGSGQGLLALDHVRHAKASCVASREALDFIQAPLGQARVRGVEAHAHQIQQARQATRWKILRLCGGADPERRRGPRTSR